MIDADHEDELREVADVLRRTALRPSSPPPAIAEAAAAAGLLDVAYATLDSPLGRLLLARTEVGLVRLAYVDGDTEETVLADIAARISPRLLAAPGRLDEPRRELDEYFAGRRRDFAVALDMRLMTEFTRRVLTVTAAIPYGSVSTYREVATRAGSPRGSRAAGNALGANPLPIIVPCHRVLHSTGGLGGYTGGLERKRTLLAIERGQLTLTAGDGA
ncbi:MAG TPA: methylated-DNA--[protein]-cysteine S-methyltransferase [Solirubrobacteraceae bacterium]|nr:methylated-DNA--[protein]-cysteine S-methyltransferase [Solirubrobacteraceae bacterium]